MRISRVSVVACVVMAISLVPSQPGGAEEDGDKSLVELAQAKFSQLKPQELDFLRAAEKGDTFQPDGYDAYKEEDKPANAENWADNRKIDAKLIEWVCTDRIAKNRVSHYGIQAFGIHVTGVLDLSGADVPFFLRLNACYIPDKVLLVDASLTSIFLGASRVNAISADRIDVKGSVFLRGLEANGEVSLLGATVGGTLDCSNGKFRNAGAATLIVNGIDVKGDVLLRDGFEADGEVSLVGATIGGSLFCRDGIFRNAKGYALGADGIDVKGNVYLSEEFEAFGSVRLLGATIGGDLNCTNGKFRNAGGDAGALNAQFLNVKNSVFLRDGFEADGTVYLVGATIGGNLEIAGNPEIGSRTKNNGKVAAIILNLTYAHVGTFLDDERSWPIQGNLLLQGFTFDRLSNEANANVEKRLEWLDRQPKDDFSSQPFVQLANYYRSQGQEKDAKRVLIERETARGERVPMGSFERALYWILWALLDYGYNPWKAFLYVIGFVLTGWVLFGIAWLEKAITATDDHAYSKKADGSRNETSYDPIYPKFNAFIFSLHTFAPLVDLHQEGYWLPNPNRGRVLWTFGTREFRTGSLYRAYMWLHILAGWVLTTALIAGFSGLLRD